MYKNNEMVFLVGFFWVAIILASAVVLAPVSPALGPLLLEIGGAALCISLMWRESKRELGKTS